MRKYLFLLCLFIGSNCYAWDNDGPYINPSSLDLYLPLTGGTMTGALNGTTASFSGGISAIGITATSGTFATNNTGGLLVGNLSRGSGEPTNPGLIRLQTNGNSAENVNGLEFKSGASASGFGYKLYANSTTDKLVLSTRYNSATWTDRITIQQSNGDTTLLATQTGSLTASSVTIESSALIKDTLRSQVIRSCTFYTCDLNPPPAQAPYFGSIYIGTHVYINGGILVNGSANSIAQGGRQGYAFSNELGNNTGMFSTGDNILNFNAAGSGVFTMDGNSGNKNRSTKANGFDVSSDCSALTFTSSNSYVCTEGYPKTTGGNTALLGANCPATGFSAPYTWIDIKIGTATCVMPVWLK